MRNTPGFIKSSHWLIRFWGAGAVCFFMAWGTGRMLGSAYDAILFLAGGLGVIEMFVIQPLIRYINNTRQPIPKSVLGVALRRIAHFLKIIVLVIFVFLFYLFINTAICAILARPAGTVVLPVEPILFGMVYTLLYALFEKITNLIEIKKEGDGL